MCVATGANFMCVSSNFEFRRMLLLVLHWSQTSTLVQLWENIWPLNIDWLNNFLVQLLNCFTCKRMKIVSSWYLEKGRKKKICILKIDCVRKSNISNVKRNITIIDNGVIFKWYSWDLTRAQPIRTASRWNNIGS